MNVEAQSVQVQPEVRSLCVDRLYDWVYGCNVQISSLLND